MNWIVQLAGKIIGFKCQYEKSRQDEYPPLQGCDPIWNNGNLTGPAQGGGGGVSILNGAFFHFAFFAVLFKSKKSGGEKLWLSPPELDLN
jgi:hypothetical protein